jgi:hypothetical protein
MFDLDSAIARWRRLLRSQGISPAALDELESHLRDDIEEQLSLGIPEERALAAASERIGEGRLLKAEFKKIRGSRTAWGQKVFRCCCLLSAGVTLLAAIALLETNRNLAERIVVLGFSGLVAGYMITQPRMAESLRHRSARLGAAKAGAFCGFVFPVILVLFLFAPIGLAVILEGVALGLGVIVATAALIGLSAAGQERVDLSGFSFAASAALDLAREEARAFHHDFVGTEHVLLGILGSPDSIAAKVLRRLGVSPDEVRAEIEKHVRAAGIATGARVEAPFTPRVQKAFVLAAAEARTMRRERVEGEHLLLGLLLESTGLAGQVLKELGIEPGAAREQILKGWGEDDDGPQAAVPA